MSQFSIGDRVSAKEWAWDPELEEQVPLTVTGVVSETKDRDGNVMATTIPSEQLYRKKPTYKKADKGSKKENKFPSGTIVYRVLIDGEKHPRNFHESQLTVCDG